MFLQGEPPVQFDCTVVELQLIQDKQQSALVPAGCTKGSIQIC